MVNAGHELMKQAGPAIVSLIQKVQWEHRGQPLSIEHTAEARQTLVNYANVEYHQEPDDSCRVLGQRLPFLVVEVRDTQTEKDLRTKVHRWAHCTRNRVKVICIFEIVPKSEGGYKAEASIIKCRKEAAPTAARPQGYKVLQDKILEKEDISSAVNPASFTIEAADVRPEDGPQDPTAVNNQITIPLALFYTPALSAINAKAKEVAQNKAKKGRSSPYGPNEEPVSTPSDSGSASSGEDSTSDSEAEDLIDGDYDES
ncbi:MAG: hypothetical protein LQ346_006295 [Caloplaca aetnensis]|nr:MAG: hypothetical protein LQ346_006295 [Caloplaca aetnensis]